LLEPVGIYCEKRGETFLKGKRGIYCEKRGETFLKGKGLVMTYWVRPGESDFYDSVRGSSAAIKSFLGLNNLIISPSNHNSLSRKPNRPSVLFEEDEEDSLRGIFRN
jgi:hypothetical protein